MVDCELQPKYNNCGGPHFATSNDCLQEANSPKKLSNEKVADTKKLPKICNGRIREQRNEYKEIRNFIRTGSVVFAA